MARQSAFPLCIALLRAIAFTGLLQEPGNDCSYAPDVGVKRLMSYLETYFRTAAGGVLSKALQSLWGGGSATG